MIGHDKRTVIGLAAALCLAICTAGFAADRSLSDLPIGHFKIIEGEEGEINVEARCVPTEKVLKTLAARTGKAIVFDQPCRTYVSLWQPWLHTTEGEWMDRAASFGGRLSCVLREGAWRVSSPEIQPHYDASMTEEAVAAKFHHDVAPMRVRQGIYCGIIIYGGTFIEPPYKLECVEQPNRGSALTVNGVPVWSFPPRPADKLRQRVPSMPASGQFTDTEILTDYVTRGLYPTLLAKRGKARARAGVVDFLKTQDIIEAVVEPDSDPEALGLSSRIFQSLLKSDNIAVIYPDRPGFGFFFPANFDLARATFFFPGGPSPIELAEARAASVAETLKRGFVIIAGSQGEVAFKDTSHLEHFAQCLRLAEGRSLLEVECLMAELVEDRALARELAVNLSGDYARLADILERLLHTAETEKARKDLAAERWEKGF